MSFNVTILCISRVFSIFLKQIGKGRIANEFQYLDLYPVCIILFCHTVQITKHGKVSDQNVYYAGTSKNLICTTIYYAVSVENLP